MINHLEKDMVSRKALYEALYEHFHDEDAPNNITEVRLGAVRNFVKNFPSVTPTQNWIPVSERYPKIEDEYKYFLVTDDKGKISIQEFLISLGAEPQPYFSGMVNVIAWQPLPQPYIAESEE